MAFFENSVCCGTNNKMVRAVEEVDVEQEPLKHTTMNDINLCRSAGKQICCRLCNKKHQAQIAPEFLQLPASQRAENHDYQTASAVARTVAVVNDHAERGVVLIHQFSKDLTKNKEQLQFLLPGIANAILKRTLFGNINN